MKKEYKKKPTKAVARRRMAAKANRQTRGVVARTQRKGKRIGSQWLRLLADPCNAPLVNAPYEGTDSGYLMRTRGSLSIATPEDPTGLTDFALQFYPGKPQNSTTSWNLGTYSIGVSGTPLNQNFAIPLPGFISPDASTVGAVGQFRPVAACIKFTYTGTTLNARGILGRALTNTQLLTETGTTMTNIRADQLLVFTNDVQRAPLVRSGEVRWVPQECDGIFSQWSMNNTAPETSIYCGNNCTLVGVGLPDDSILLDWTVCWEWTPSAYQGLITGSTPTFSGLAPIMKAPSPVPFNSVVAQIPSPGAFAVSPLDRLEKWLGIAASATGLGQAARSIYNSAMESSVETGMEELVLA